jgi:hypothetical protein
MGMDAPRARACDFERYSAHALPDNAATLLAASRAMSKASRGAAAAARATGRGDIERWRSTLQMLERDWFAPLHVAPACGGYPALRSSHSTPRGAGATTSAAAICGNSGVQLDRSIIMPDLYRSPRAARAEHLAALAAVGMHPRWLASTPRAVSPRRRNSQPT